jgi:hypothetical protein
VVDDPTLGLEPEGETGLWVFSISIPGIGEIRRGEVTVNSSLADEPLPIEVQRATAMEKINVLAQVLIKASTRTGSADGI